MRKPRHRRPNPQLIKIHRTYTVDEAARLLSVHKNTVRNWIKQGLPALDDRQPTLLHGHDLRKFHTERRKNAKQPCGPGEMYCVKCREPKRPAGAMADYLPISETVGNLQGICPDCETFIHRRISKARIAEDCGDLDITFPEAASRIRERNFPSLNSDSQGDRSPHDHAQSE